MTVYRDKLDQQSQYERFVEKARELGCDDRESQFNATLKKLTGRKTGKKNGGSVGDLPKEIG